MYSLVFALRSRSKADNRVAISRANVESRVLPHSTANVSIAKTASLSATIGRGPPVNETRYSGAKATAAQPAALARASAPESTETRMAITEAMKVAAAALATILVRMRPPRCRSHWSTTRICNAATAPIPRSKPRSRISTTTPVTAGIASSLAPLFLARPTSLSWLGCPMRWTNLRVGAAT